MLRLLLALALSLSTLQVTTAAEYVRIWIEIDLMSSYGPWTIGQQGECGSYPLALLWTKDAALADVADFELDLELFCWVDSDDYVVAEQEFDIHFNDDKLQFDDATVYNRAWGTNSYSTRWVAGRNSPDLGQAVGFGMSIESLFGTFDDNATISLPYCWTTGHYASGCNYPNTTGIFEPCGTAYRSAYPGGTYTIGNAMVTVDPDGFESGWQMMRARFDESIAFDDYVDGERVLPDEDDDTFGYIFGPNDGTYTLFYPDDLGESTTDDVFCCAIQRFADANLDGYVNGSDASHFTQGLNYPATYASDHGQVPALFCCDVNDDDAVNGLDVSPMAAAIVNGGVEDDFWDEWESAGVLQRQLDRVKHIAKPIKMIPHPLLKGAEKEILAANMVPRWILAQVDDVLGSVNQSLIPGSDEWAAEYDRVYLWLLQHIDDEHLSAEQIALKEAEEAE